jgi:ribosome biogenesis GTPase
LDTNLHVLGWNSELAEAFRPHEERSVPGRIAVEHRGMYAVYTDAGEMWAEIAGKMRHDAGDRSDFPAVGDWVVLQPRPGDDWATITAILPRRSAFVRKEAGFRTGGQVLASNIDLVWIVAALTRGLSARRIERFLAVAWESGAQPVVVLTKADIGEAEPERVAEVEQVAVGAPVVVTSAVTGEGLDELRVQLVGDKTAALLGSSGVGKSTLINKLVGDGLLETRETDARDVGRHTTVRRELVAVPSGGLLIDTPGLRELVSWDAEEGVDAVFADIEELIGRCRFADCAHRTEPGCAVRAALASGELEPARLRTFEKMQRELRYVERRKVGKAELKVKRKVRRLSEAALRRAELES